MSKVDNIDPMERIIHQAFHDLSEKYDVDVDTIAKIITEYDEIISSKLEERIVVSLN